LKRPEIQYNDLIPLFDEVKCFEKDITDQIEYEIKYEGFIARQSKNVEKFKYIENIRIPENIDYDKISGLSIEICQKLKHFAPVNLGQANRISGVTPSAISILMVYLKKERNKKNESR